MSNILIYPADRRTNRPVRDTATPNDTYTDPYADPFMGLGWLIAAVGLLCMLSAIALAGLNLA